MTLFDIPPFDEPDSMCMFLMLVLWYGLIYRYTIIIFVVHLTLWPDTILMNAIVITWTRKILFINWLNIKTNYIVNFTCDIIIKLHTPKCYILEMTVTWKWDAWPSEVWNPPALYIMYWQTNSSNIFISGWRSMCYRSLYKCGSSRVILLHHLYFRIYTYYSTTDNRFPLSIPKNIKCWNIKILTDTNKSYFPFSAKYWSIKLNAQMTQYRI